MEGHSRKADRYLLLVMGKDERRWGGNLSGALLSLCPLPSSKVLRLIECGVGGELAVDEQQMSLGGGRA